jgi:hypothetical protein
MGPIFTTKDTKDTKFRFNPTGLREARAYSLVLFFVPFASLVAKKGFAQDRPAMCEATGFRLAASPRRGRQFGFRSSLQNVVS